MNIPHDIDAEEATAQWFDWVRKIEAQRQEEDRSWEEEFHHEVRHYEPTLGEYETDAERNV